jgi:hypothetical protein
MKQPSPLPTEPPFLTFYTPTFHRPFALAKCMASIEKQTARHRVEQIIVPDFVGYGIANGLYGRIPWYAEACRGEYVHILADDDELLDERAVEKVIAFAEKKMRPPVIMVNVIKGGFEYPCCNPFGPPQVSEVDLGCYILRRDIWLRHYKDYGDRYEGDFDHAVVLHEHGYRREHLDLFFVEGGASNGRPEA